MAFRVDLSPPIVGRRTARLGATSPLGPVLAKASNPPNPAVADAVAPQKTTV